MPKRPLEEDTPSTGAKPLPAVIKEKRDNFVRWLLQHPQVPLEAKKEIPKILSLDVSQFRATVLGLGRERNFDVELSKGDLAKYFKVNPAAFPQEDQEKFKKYVYCFFKLCLQQPSAPQASSKGNTSDASRDEHVQIKQEPQEDQMEPPAKRPKTADVVVAGGDGPRGGLALKLPPASFSFPSEQEVHEVSPPSPSPPSSQAQLSSHDTGKGPQSSGVSRPQTSIPVVQASGQEETLASKQQKVATAEALEKIIKEKKPKKAPSKKAPQLPPPTQVTPLPQLPPPQIHPPSFLSHIPLPSLNTNPPDSSVKPDTSRAN